MRHFTPEQRAKAEERRSRFRLLVTQIAAMTDDQRNELAARIPGVVTCDGHALSFHNTCLVASQCPMATMVGGFRQWLKHARVVRRGEHGLMIWVPKRKAVSDPNSTDEISPVCDTDKPDMWFLMGTVFDISQTEAAAGSGKEWNS